MAEEMQIDVTDPSALAAMFDKLESGAEPAAEPKDEPGQAAAAGEPAGQSVEPDGKEASKDAPAAEADPDGVATKDGKHIIPYSVLKADRDRATRAEQALRDAQAQLAALEAAAKAGQPGVKGESAATIQQANDAGELSEEDMAALKEDFPTVYKGLMAMRAQAAAMQAQFKPVQESVQSAEAARALTVVDQVQEAIDATPKLAHIKATNPAAFDLAKQFDNTLKGQAAWADKPLSERFAKVVELVEQASGPITIPGQSKAPPPAQKSAEAMKAEARALAELAAKASKTSVPTSLSEFAAGDPVARDEREAVTNMSSLQLAAKFASMSPEKLDAYLQNL